MVERASELWFWELWWPPCSATAGDFQATFKARGVLTGDCSDPELAQQHQRRWKSTQLSEVLQKPAAKTHYKSIQVYCWGVFKHVQHEIGAGPEFTTFRLFSLFFVFGDLSPSSSSSLSWGPGTLEGQILASQSSTMTRFHANSEKHGRLETTH